MIPVTPESGPVFRYLSTTKKIPFCVSSALRAADLGFLLSVKCLESGGCGPTMATSADLFKYKHSKGRKLDPLSGRFATTEKKKINI